MSPILRCAERACSKLGVHIDATPTVSLDAVLNAHVPYLQTLWRPLDVAAHVLEYGEFVFRITLQF